MELDASYADPNLHLLDLLADRFTWLAVASRSSAMIE